MQSEGGHTLLSQREAAEGAGLSKHQQVIAVRVANVADDHFEELVESESLSAFRRRVSYRFTNSKSNV